MNSKFLYAVILSLLLLAIGCTKSDMMSNGHNVGDNKYSTKVDFDVTIDAVDMDVAVSPITTRVAVTDDISDLWYVLYDDKGAPMPAKNGDVMRYVDYTNVVGFGEMLPVGSYTAVFLGFSSGVKRDDQIKAIEAMGDNWLAISADALADGIYYYHRGELKVVEGQPNEFTVSLKPVVGQFVLNLNMEQGQGSMVSQVEVCFDTTVYTSFNADGSYGKPTDSSFATILGPSYTFYSLPTVGEAVSGKVKITLVPEGEKAITREYPFKNLPLKAGEITRLDLTLDLAYNNFGVIKVDRDFSVATFEMTMLQDDEDPNLYGITTSNVTAPTDLRRSFVADAPLRVSVRGDALELQFYSFQGISDIDVYMDIDGVEPFKVCHVDTMPPLKEFKAPFALAITEASYETMSGKIIKLPAMPEIKEGGAKFIIKSSDPYFKQKIEPIKCRWICCFRNELETPEIIAGDEQILEMNPRIARQGLAVMLNMASVFSTDEFRDELYARQGKLYWDGPSDKPTATSRQVDTRDFYRKVLRLERLGVSLLSGSALGLMYKVCYMALKPNYFNYPYTDINVYVWFHEFAHVMGSIDYVGNLNDHYSKSYPDRWVTFTSDIYTKMAGQKRLPVYNQSMIDGGQLKK